MTPLTIKDNEDSYVNRDGRIPYCLDPLFKSVLSLSGTVQVNHIDIYFNTYKKKVHGSLSITVKTAGLECPYLLDLTDINDDTPIRLQFDKPFVVRGQLETLMQATYASDDKIAVWTNLRGMCCTINSLYEETVTFEETPKISIITPVYKTDLDLLSQTIQSVKDQYYPNWELCLVDDGSKDAPLTKYLNGLTSDPRIKLAVMDSTGGIVSASNTAISMSTGGLLCCLDHDDILPKRALLEVVREYNKDPDADLFYSDEEKINMENVPYDIFHKPGWSYTQFLSQNILNHLVVYKTGYVKDLEGYRQGYDGAQDYDLSLRYIEHHPKVTHIPKVLYRWRATKDSTASGHHHKPFSRINAVRAISGHLQRVNVEAAVTSDILPGVYRVDRWIAGSPSVNIIIPFKDKLDYLKACLYSIKQSTYRHFRITLVDNQSEEESTLDFLRDIPEEYYPDRNDQSSYITVLSRPGPFNFSSLNNTAVRDSDPSDLVLFLNNDTEVIATDWLEQMVQHGIRKDVGAVGAKLLYADGRIQHAGVIVGIGGVAGHSHKYVPNSHPGYFNRPHVIQETSAVTGACMMVRREVFDAVGGFEEALPRAFQDIDLCLKIRQLGYKIVYTPYATLYHYESISRGRDSVKDKDFKAAINYMIRKWDCGNYNDPYYNPNLTLSDEKFSFS